MKTIPAIVLTGLLCLGLFGANTADATMFSPTSYQSFIDSPFKSTFTGSGFQYFLDDFESESRTPGYAVNGGGLTTLHGDLYTDSVDGTNKAFSYTKDGQIRYGGSTGRSWFSLYDGKSGLSEFTFAFSPIFDGKLPTHAGIVWTDTGWSRYRVGDADDYFGYDWVSFSYIDSLGVSHTLNPHYLGNGSNIGKKIDDRFFGAYDANGIQSFSISMLNSIDWEVDHLQYGAAVPEPSTLFLCAAGFVGLAACRRFAKR